MANVIGIRPSNIIRCTILRTILPFCLSQLAVCAFTARETRAAGSITFDSSSFFKSSRDRDPFASILLIEPKFSGESRVLEAAADIRAATFLNRNSSFTFDAREAYVGSSSRFSSLHKISAGRKAFDWSVADRQWDIGVWSPRFALDPFVAEQLGTTGLLYEYRSKRWTLGILASPVAVPEQGIPMIVEDGKISSASPMFVPLQEQIEVMGQIRDIRYELKFPEVSDIVLRPNAAIYARYEGSSGFWISGAYGYMPIHQADVAVDATLNPTSGELESDLYPRFGMHHLGTVEMGYRASYWSVWGSITGEMPERIDTPEGWFANRTGEALISAWGGELRWQEGLVLHASYLQVSEPNAAGPEDMDVQLPTRYMYRRAWRVGGGWKGYSPISYDFGWTFDAEHSSNLVSVDVRFSPWSGGGRDRESSWTVGLGADFITTATGTGWIGQYQGNDRVRGKVTYAF